MLDATGNAEVAVKRNQLNGKTMRVQNAVHCRELGPAATTSILMSAYISYISQSLQACMVTSMKP